ncbi:MAG TPA: sigma-54 dependent transcriptional regulator [Planctomycetota bacterium]|jgi:DNA-binding NtrC family response regulator|nr:sigma-54 dependent transcriptional regulator [Planctomycetota bacterium]
MRILIVEDDDALGELLLGHCQDRGHAADRVRQASECFGAIEARRPDCLFLDVLLGDGNGLDLLPELKRRHGGLRVTVMTGYEPLSSVSRASAGGAEYFLRKPFKIAEVDAVLQKLEQHGSPPGPAAETPAAGLDPAPAATFVGSSGAMTEVCRNVGLSARSGVTTLIEGESGVGKELAARAIHALGGPGRPFVALDCATIVETLFESELFGHERGAFTGAHASREGKVVQAEGGVLFLDEVAELTPRMQAKLLRLLQARTFEPVGGSRSLQATFQLVAATNRGLGDMVRQGSFRSDLYYRLNVLRIAIPPLRERREDVPALVAHFLREIPRKIRLPAPDVDPEALAALAAHAWPGNVRELEHTITRLVLQSQGRRIDRMVVTAALGGEAAASPARTLDDLERSAILASLEHTGWNFGEACSLLGISRPTLRRKIARYELRR